jgi:hypothetical protein
MADINQEAQELAEAMRQAAEDIRRYGRLQQDTADAFAVAALNRQHCWLAKVCCC